MKGCNSNPMSTECHHQSVTNSALVIWGEKVHRKVLERDSAGANLSWDKSLLLPSRCQKFFNLSITYKIINQDP